MRKEIKLGNEVRDRVSGFKGIAVAEIKYLNGCVRWQVQGRADKEGKVPDPLFFDEQQVDVVGKGVHTTSKETGGDREPPKGYSNPR